MNHIGTVDPEKCVGCASCANACPASAITMQSDDNGFPAPVLNGEKCVSCGVCLRGCPVSYAGFNQEEPAVYAVSLKDRAAKKSSSSGGAFYWLASQILARGGVVYGAAFDTAARKVRHLRVDALADLPLLQNSKYVQSEIGGAYRLVQEDLAAGRQVLFSGTPCQVAGLYAFLGARHEHLFTCDILCYGVPSPLVLDRYLAETVGEEQILSLNMRDKTAGWVNYSMQITTGRGRYLQSKHTDLYQLGFQTHLFYRASCYHCHFRREQRVGDITLGDFWEIKERFQKHSLRNNDTGISFVMVNSAQGRALFESADQSAVLLEKRALADNAENYGFKKSMEQDPARETFFARLKETRYSEAIAPYIIKEEKRKPSLAKRAYRALKRFYCVRALLHKLGVQL